MKYHYFTVGSNLCYAISWAMLAGIQISSLKVFFIIKLVNSLYLAEFEVKYDNVEAWNSTPSFDCI